MRTRPASPTCHVYRTYSEGQLLYIGSSHQLWERFRQHRKNSWWSPLVDKVRAEVHPTCDDARRAEMAAILAERPAWNLQDLQQALLPRWDEHEFAEYLHQWLVHDRNSRDYHLEQTGKPSPKRSRWQFERLISRYNYRHKAPFDLDLLADVEDLWRSLPEGELIRKYRYPHSDNRPQKSGMTLLRRGWNPAVQDEKLVLLDEH